jgi:N(2)-fixation sustaining protein CowN
MAEALNKETKTDRYVSFKGIDCAGNARRVMDYVRSHIDDAARTNVFWQHIQRRWSSGVGPKQDDMLFVHVYLNQIRELFEERNDLAALALLDQIEEECC